MKEKITLICLEGMDRTGKDTLLEDLKSKFSDYLVYQPVSAEKENIDFKNKEVFEEWIRKYIRKVLDDLYTMAKINGTNRPIVMTRLLLTDNVFSDLFGRDHIVEKYYKKEIETNFNLINYIFLFDDYDEYVGRVKKINDSIDFSKEEFDKISSLFIKYRQPNADIILPIANEDTKDDIFNCFLMTFDYLTPSYIG